MPIDEQREVIAGQIIDRSATLVVDNYIDVFEPSTPLVERAVVGKLKKPLLAGGIIKRCRSMRVGCSSHSGSNTAWACSKPTKGKPRWI